VSLVLVRESWRVPYPRPSSKGSSRARSATSTAAPAALRRRSLDTHAAHAAAQNCNGALPGGQDACTPSPPWQGHLLMSSGRLRRMRWRSSSSTRVRGWWAMQQRTPASAIASLQVFLISAGAGSSALRKRH